MSLRQQNKARARANILAAAATLIAAGSVARTTTRQIARHAGVSYQTLYNHFPSKAHIIGSLMAEDLASWRLQVDGAIKHYNGNLLETLDQINRIGQARVSGDNLEQWREIGLHAFGQAPGREQIGSINQVSHERYHALLSMAQGMGQLSADVDLHLMAHTTFCLCDYALLRFIFLAEHDNAAREAAEPASVASLRTLHEQLALLIEPHLI